MHAGHIKESFLHASFSAHPSSPQPADRTDPCARVLSPPYPLAALASSGPDEMCGLGRGHIDTHLHHITTISEKVSHKCKRPWRLHGGVASLKQTQITLCRWQLLPVLSASKTSVIWLCPTLSAALKLSVRDKGSAFIYLCTVNNRKWVCAMELFLYHSNIPVDHLIYFSVWGVSGSRGVGGVGKVCKPGTCGGYSACILDPPYCRLPFPEWKIALLLPLVSSPWVAIAAPECPFSLETGPLVGNPPTMPRYFYWTWHNAISKGFLLWMLSNRKEIEFDDSRNRERMSD